MVRFGRPSRSSIVAPWLLLACSAGLFACGSCGTSPEANPDSEPLAFEEPDPEQIAFGARLYRIHGCVTCHTIDGRPSTAPTFLGAYGQTRVLTNGRRAVVNPDYIRRSIREPSAEIVAGYTNQMIRYTPELLSDVELDALVAFIMSLRDRDEEPLPAEEPDDPSIDEPTNPASEPAEPATPGPSETEGGDDLDAEDPGDIAGSDAAAPEPLRLRPDGRPEWWLDRPTRTEEGRVMLSAEALGESFRGAGDRALDEARRQLRIQMNLSPDASIPDEQVERTLVLPLPNPGGAFRFVGYVKVSGAPAQP